MLISLQRGVRAGVVPRSNALIGTDAGRRQTHIVPAVPPAPHATNDHFHSPCTPMQTASVARASKSYGLCAQLQVTCQA